MNILKKYIATGPLLDDGNTHPNCQRVYLSSWADMEINRITNERDTAIRLAGHTVPELHAKLEELTRLRAENERLQSELAALRRPVVQSDEVEAIRKEWKQDIASLQEAIRAGYVEQNDITDAAVAVNTLLSALDQAQRELSAVRAVANKQGDGDLAELERLRAEIARLSSPPQERGEIVERQQQRKGDMRDFGRLLREDSPVAVTDIDTLLGDCAAWRNAHALVTAQLKTAHETIVGLTPEAVRHADQIEERQRSNAAHKDWQQTHAQLVSERLEQFAPPDYWATLHDRVASVISWKERCTNAEKRIERLEGANKALASAACAVLEWAKGRMPCPAGECCAELRAQIRSLSAALGAHVWANAQSSALAAADGRQEAPEQSLIETTRRSPRVVDAGNLRDAADGQPQEISMVEYARQMRDVADGQQHHEYCDTNDKNAEGIAKPCNCGTGDGVEGE